MSSSKMILITEFQKFLSILTFSGLYLFAGIRKCNWVINQLSGLSTVMQFLILPCIALALAGPANLIVFKIWKRG